MFRVLGLGFRASSCAVADSPCSNGGTSPGFVGGVLSVILWPSSVNRKFFPPACCDVMGGNGPGTRWEFRFRV